jgi:uncharacterized protein YcfL
MKNLLYKIILVLLVIGSSPFLVQTLAEDDLHDLPDSIRYILGIEVDKSRIVELSGQNIKSFSLYTNSSKSTILWVHNNEYYMYALSDADHLEKATELFKLLKKHGLDTYITTVKGKDIRLYKYHPVYAMKLKGNKE